MNKDIYKHIIYLFFGILIHSNAFGLNSSLYIEGSEQTVTIDEDYLDKRDYDNLSDRYNGEEFIYERNIDNSGWWTRFKQWLSDFFKDLFDFKTEAKAANFTTFAINTFFVILFLLVVFFLVKAIMNKDGKWVFGKSSDKSIIPITDIENNIYQTDFKSLISSAEADNNYRLAIRYYYLWLLKTLSEAEVIDYDVEKTNSDYYLEITNESIKKEFSYTSYLYNYIWYGEFDIDNNRYVKAKEAYSQFLYSIQK